MNKKYEILYDKSIEIAGKKLYRIRALISFKIHGMQVKIGDEGGYIENENCLSINDRSWLFNNSEVFNSKVFNNSTVGDSRVFNSYVDNSRVFNNSKVEDSRVFNSDVDNSKVEDSKVEDSKVDNSKVVQQTITKQPLAITLPIWNVTIVNNDIRISCRFYSIEQWDNFTDEEISEMDDKALEWWKTYKESILTLARTVKND